MNDHASGIALDCRTFAILCGPKVVRLSSKGIKPKLNENFLRLLGEAYALRYPDDLSSGFNIVLSRVRILTELDSSVYEVRRGFSFSEGDHAAEKYVQHGAAPNLHEHVDAYQELTEHLIADFGMKGDEVVQTTLQPLQE